MATSRPPEPRDLPWPGQPVPTPPPVTPQAALEAAQARIAASADARGEGWVALGRLVQPPTEELLAGLVDGSLARVLIEATTWLGEDRQMVAGPLSSLEVYTRRAQRGALDSELESLVEDREEIASGPLGPRGVEDLAGPMREMAVLCHQEAKAWASGDLDQGKALRAQQSELARERLVHDLPPVAKALVDEGIADLTRVIGRLLLAFLSAETGKDYQRAVLGDPRSRSRL